MTTEDEPVDLAPCESIMIDEDRPEQLRAMWIARNNTIVQSIERLGDDLQYLAAIEEKIRKPDDIKELGRQYRRALDHKEAIGAIFNALQERIKTTLDEQVAKFRQRTGLDKLTTGYVTFSIEDQQKAVYDPEQYEKILVGLVGIDASVDNAIRIRDAFEKLGSEEEVSKAIRASLTIGNLGILQRRFTDSKVLEMAENGIEFPEGLSITTIPNVVRASRAVGTKKAY